MTEKNEEVEVEVEAEEEAPVLTPEELLESLKAAKNNLSKMQERLVLEETEDGLEIVDVDGPESEESGGTYITVEKADEILYITDRLLTQLSMIKDITDRGFQQASANLIARILAVQSRILSHLEK